MEAESLSLHLMDLSGWRDQALQTLDLLCAVKVRGEGWRVSREKYWEGEMERIMEGLSAYKNPTRETP